VVKSSAQSKADVQTWVETSATLTAGSIKVEALSNNYAKAEANRYSGGAKDVGVIIPEAVSGGVTSAYIKQSAAGASGQITATGDLVIRAKSANTADSHAQANGGAIVGVNVTTPISVVNPMISASIDGGANIAVGNNVEVISMSEADAILTVNSGGGAAVAVDVAGATAEIVSDIDTYIADNARVVAGQGITLQSLHNTDAAGNRLTHAATGLERGAAATVSEASGGLIDVGVLKSSAQAKADVQTWVETGASLDPTAGSITLESLSNNYAKANAHRYDGGGVTVGVLVSEAVSGGVTSAYVKENAAGGAGLTTNVNDLVIRAKSANTADAHTEAYGGAIVGVNVTAPAAVVNPTISAYIDAGADVNVGGRVELSALSEADAVLTVNGGGGAAVAVNVADTTAEIISDVDTYIADEATVVAGQGISLQSLHNTDAAGNRITHAATGSERGAVSTVTEASGGLVNVGVLKSSAQSLADVQTWVATGASLNATAGGITLESMSNNYAKANANRYAGGVVDVGVLVSEAVSGGTTSAYVKENAAGGSGLITAANDLVLRAKSANTADSHTEAYGGAIVGVNVTTPTAVVNPTISAHIEAGAAVDVDGTVSISSMSEADAILTVDSGGGAAVAVDVAEAKAEIVSDIDTYIADGAGVAAGQDIILRSLHNYDTAGNRLTHAVRMSGPGSRPAPR
jgi:hypothetical protein